MHGIFGRHCRMERHERGLHEIFSGEPTCAQRFGRQRPGAQFKGGNRVLCCNERLGETLKHDTRIGATETKIIAHRRIQAGIVFGFQ